MMGQLEVSQTQIKSMTATNSLMVCCVRRGIQLMLGLWSSLGRILSHLKSEGIDLIFLPAAFFVGAFLL